MRGVARGPVPTAPLHFASNALANGRVTRSSGFLSRIQRAGQRGPRLEGTGRKLAKKWRDDGQRRGRKGAENSSNFPGGSVEPVCRTAFISIFDSKDFFLFFSPFFLSFFFFFRFGQTGSANEIDSFKIEKEGEGDRNDPFHLSIKLRSKITYFYFNFEIVADTYNISMTTIYLYYYTEWVEMTCSSKLWGNF